MATQALPGMQDLLDGFVQRLAATRSKRTTQTYGHIAAEFLVHLGKRKNPDRRSVEGFLTLPGKRGGRLAIATQNQTLAAVRSLGKYAVCEGSWPENPTDGIAFLREPLRDPAVLSLPEVQRLFDVVERISQPSCRARDQAMLALLFTLGLRVHELVALDVDQVDVASATLLSVRGKGGTIHDLPLGASTIRLIERWLIDRHGRAAAAEPALLVSRSGHRLSIRSVERLFERLRAATGTKKRITPHTARHTAATLALSRGSDISAVGELLRHADLNTTRRYAHLVDTRRRRVVEMLSDVIPEKYLREASGTPDAGAKLPDRGYESSSAVSGSAPANDNAQNLIDDQDDLGVIGLLRR